MIQRVAAFPLPTTEGNDHGVTRCGATPCRTGNRLGDDGHPLAGPCRTGNAGIVDAAWAAEIGILGIFYAATSDGYLPRRVLAAVLIGVWSARLALYILLDRVLGRPEDGRYRTLREEWGTTAGRRLFFFFQTQALAAWFFALPVIVVADHPVDHWTAWDLAGLLIWCISVGNTILADRQLVRFKRRPESRGKTCREGWWRYSRHPNYFFEWLHWWSYVAPAAGSSYWWVTLLRRPPCCISC